MYLDAKTRISADSSSQYNADLTETTLFFQSSVLFGESLFFIGPYVFAMCMFKQHSIYKIVLLFYISINKYNKSI